MLALKKPVIPNAVVNTLLSFVMIMMLVPPILVILKLDAVTMPSLVMMKVNALTMVVIPLQDVGSITSIAMMIMLVLWTLVMLPADVPMLL